jgi:hypothetical protein
MGNCTSFKNENQALKKQAEEKQKVSEKQKALKKQQKFPYEVHGDYLCMNIKNSKDHIFKKYIGDFYNYINTVKTSELKSVVAQDFNNIDVNSYGYGSYCNYRYTNYNLSNKSYVYCLKQHTFNCDLNVKFIFVIFDIIETDSMFNIIIPVSIIGRGHNDNFCDFQINLKHEINDSFYSYNYYDVVFNNQKSLNLNLQICKNCHEIYNKKHCNKCHLNYDDKHCCDCKQKYDKKHCDKCHKNYDNYHCCNCGQNYNIFSINCECVKNNNECIICTNNCDKTVIYYRTICNKSVICKNCLIVSNLTKCPCCRKSDVKNHIIK